MEGKKVREVAKVIKEQVLQNDPVLTVDVLISDVSYIRVMPTLGNVIFGVWLSRVVMYCASFGYSIYCKSENDNPILYIY